MWSKVCAAAQSYVEFERYTPWSWWRIPGVHREMAAHFEENRADHLR